MTRPSSEEDPIDVAFAEYLRACDSGRLSSREDFLARFPELREQLRELMEAADVIGRATRQVPGTTPAADSSPGGAQDWARGETLARSDATESPSLDWTEITLPMANRPVGEPGPRLPFKLGDYRLLEMIGRGGMGIVYLANQLHLDRTVAVKMIRSGIFADESEVRRFYSEAQAAAKLRHPGIVAVYQFGERAGHHYFSMEYIEGIDLQRRINQSPLVPREAAECVRDVATAISHAHQNGVIHRDLKPANVLIDKAGSVHVTDFGLAKHLDAESSITDSGAAIGTPYYMAPEQAGGHSDRSTIHGDIYSLGAMLFACVCGRPPIVGDTAMQTLVQVVHQPAPPLRSICPDAPADLETIVAQCLEKSPDARYATAMDLADDLDAFLNGRPIKATPRNAAIKAWHWLQGVPVVGAMSGRRHGDTSLGHRRFQALLFLGLLVAPFVLALAVNLRSRLHNRMPSRVRIAGGLPNGVYNTISGGLSEALRDRFRVETVLIPSGGSLDNRHRLRDDAVDLAPMQASALTGDQLCVVAPLFHEAVHVLARQDSAIREINDLAGHRIAVGPRGSGSRLAAELVFESLELSAEICPREVIAWSDLQRDDAPIVAVVCIGKGSKMVADLLGASHRRWRLIPLADGIQIALDHPTLQPMTIRPAEYPGVAVIPPDGITTVGTTAFLASRPEASRALVIGVLEALYREAPPARAGRFGNITLIPRRRVAEWQGLNFHTAAREFFATEN